MSECDIKFAHVYYPYLYALAFRDKMVSLLFFYIYTKLETSIHSVMCEQRHMSKCVSVEKYTLYLQHSFISLLD
jgi:hypothetical protein